MKTCTKCGEEKAKSEFKQEKGRASGVSSWCKVCHAAAHRGYYKNNKEKVSARTSARQKEKYLEDPEKMRAMWRKYRENGNRFRQALTASRSQSGKCGYKPCDATLEELEAAFTGRCKICGTPEIECTRRLALDHDHDDGSFRGWLCGNCNRLLGHARDSRKVLVSALHYLTHCKVKQK